MKISFRVRRNLRRLVREAADLLYPPRCMLCGKPLVSSTVRICGDCQRQFEEERNCRCPACGERADTCACRYVYLEQQLIPGVVCLTERFYYPSRTGNQGKLTRQLILRSKTGRNDDAAEIFARELAHRIGKELSLRGERVSDWTVTYPPRNPANRLKYGFDHGEVLAENLAYYLGIPCRTVLRRSGGRAQKTLDGEARYENSANTLDILSGAEIKGTRLILVDDVVTTGATLAVSAELLMKAGAATVLPAAAARTAYGESTEIAQ